MMDSVKGSRVMVEHLSWEDLQFHKLSFQNSEMSLVSIQRVAIKEEMNDGEDCNYDHLSKDDLIKEVKARDDRIRKLEAECNVLNSNMEKESVKTALTINKQMNEIERLSRVIKELEKRIKDLMEKRGIDQLANLESFEKDSGIVMQQQPQDEIQSLQAQIINDVPQSLLDTEAIKLKGTGNGSLQIAEAVSVQGILGKEDVIQETPVSEPQYFEEVGNTITETKITTKKAENAGHRTPITNLCVAKLKFSDRLPLLVPSSIIKVENQFKMSPDTMTKSDSPPEPLENNININDSYCKTQSVSTEGDTEVITTRSKKLGVLGLNVEVEKRLVVSLDANNESDSLEGALENDLDDNQSKINLSDAQKTDNRQNQTLYVDTRTLSVPLCVPKLELIPNELSELTSVSVESDLPDVPIEVGNNSSVSNSETFEEIAPKNSKVGKFKKKRSTRIKYSAEYKRHVKKYNDEKPLKCDQCEYTCTKKCDLIRHQRVHSGEKPFKCDQCDYASVRKDDLTRHQRVHSGEQLFKCEQCEYGCIDKSNLIRHKRVHSGEKPFKCDECEYTSRRKCYLITHRRIHGGENPFKCNQCEYGCTWKYNLIAHQRIHSGEQHFQCDQCEYGCADKSNLIRHKRVHSGTEKLFKCSECEYAGRRKCHLITHQRIHSGEKPFKCDQCEFECTQKGALIRHQLVHSGEKPFKCDECEYASRRKCHLITHQRIHSRENPFKCNQCEYGCTHKGSLIRHQRVHSGEKPSKCD